MTYCEKIIQSCEKYLKFNFWLTPVCSFDHEGMSEQNMVKCNSPGKAAILKGWKTIPCTSIYTIQKWLERFPKMNIGLVLGKNSGYIAVDIDLKGGEKIFEILSGGIKYHTWSYRTPGDGRRLIFKIPKQNEGCIFNRCQFENEDGECTFMGQGQQSVLPPSVHYTGEEYSWIVSPEECKCLDAPKWIVEMMINSEDINTTYDGLD